MHLELVVANILVVFKHFPQTNLITSVRCVQVEDIDHLRPWVFFDGSSQEQQLTYGGGGCLYISTIHSFQLSIGLGRVFNNFAELMALKLLLLFVVEKNCHTLQVFGDSLIVIDWDRGFIRCHVIRLLPILEEVALLQHRFHSISFTHVYREWNGVADMLSKEAMQLPFGCWNILEPDPAGSYSYYHCPFNEEHVLFA